MLLKRETLKGIESGSITLAFRRWLRPTVKTGGTLLTSVGQLAIEAVEVVSLEQITESEAVAAGFSDLASLRSQLLRRADGDVYRVVLTLAALRAGDPAHFSSRGAAAEARWPLLGG